MYKKKRKIKKIEVSNDPKIITNTILPSDDKNTIKKKNQKQFMTTDEAMLWVEFDDGSFFGLNAPMFYSFDGATIPFGIGKGDMKLLIPALYHDIMCEHKEYVNYDRALASDIFKELLIYNHVNKITANTMYVFVEMFQKLFCDWKEK